MKKELMQELRTDQMNFQEMLSIMMLLMKSSSTVEQFQRNVLHVRSWLIARASVVLRRTVGNYD